MYSLVDNTVPQFCVVSHLDPVKQDGIRYERFITDMYTREQD